MDTLDGHRCELGEGLLWDERTVLGDARERREMLPTRTLLRQHDRLRLRPRRGRLYRLDLAETVPLRVLSDLTIGKWLAWSMDGRTMYFFDTRRVDAWDYDLDEGTISNRRTVLEIAEATGV